MKRHYISSILITVAFLSNPLIADEWDETYNEGKLALELDHWDEAISKFQSALKLRSKPDRQATTSNLQLVEYLPYFYLGQAYFFAGKYDLALESFQKARQAGAINKTPHQARLVTLIRMSRQLLQSESQGQASQSASEEIESQLAILDAYLEQGNDDQALILVKQLREQRPQDKALLTLERSIQKGRQKPAFQPKQAEPGSKTQERFHKGLDYFLLGEYEQALQEFRAAKQLDPELSLATGMISKTLSEMERLNLPDKQVPQVIQDTTFIRETTEPVFALSSPTEPLSETRSSQVTLSGRVVDDQGIDYVVVTVNSKEVLSMRPGAIDDAKSFSFLGKVPLQMGENQIVLSAFDVDSTRHRALDRVTVIRMPAIYQTTAFAVSVAAIFLLSIAIFFVTKIVKYRIAIVNKYNPYIAGSPIRKREMFFGREKLIKRILNSLHNNSMMVYGPRRIGKTTLQHQLKYRLEKLDDPDYDFIPVMIDLQGTSEKRFFHTLMEEILEICKPKLKDRISFRLDAKGGDYSGRDFSHDLKKLIERLSAQTEKKVKLVLLIDEVDELNKYSEQVNQKLRSVFMKTFAENLAAIMSGAYLKKTWESEGSPWYNFFEEIEVPPFESEDAVRLITEPVAGIFSYDEAAINKVITYSECKPYIIQKFCVNVINRIIEEKRRRVTPEDVELVKEQVLRRTETVVVDS
ncbi:MAG: ATP-binding protein [bacterium]